MPYLTEVERNFQSRAQAVEYLEKAGYRFKHNLRIWTWPACVYNIDGTRNISAQHMYEQRKTDRQALNLLTYHHLYRFEDQSQYAKLDDSQQWADPEHIVQHMCSQGYRYNVTYRVLLCPDTIITVSDSDRQRLNTLRRVFGITMTANWRGLYDRAGICL